jgi:quinol monooxygenase YgiN
MINKMVTYKVRKESIEEAKMLVREFVENIKLNEEDTLLYRALQEKSNPARFIHFMTFEDEYAENQHRNANYNEEFVQSIVPLCEDEPVFTDLNRLAFHD